VLERCGAVRQERAYVERFADVVPETSTSLIDHSSDVQSLTEKIQVVMGQNCRVRFQKVDDIPTNASGKYPYVISRRSVRQLDSAAR
jgi:hypothetical protein